MEVVAVVALGLGAGVVAGLLGVGGGIVFVPTLAIVLDLPLVEAEATSLLAMIPVALVGALRQRRYGNLRAREGVTLGLLAAAGGFAGVAVANALPQRALEFVFAALLLAIAAQLARRGLTQPA